MKNCKNCGKEIKDNSSNKVKIWCSDKCRKQFNRRGKSSVSSSLSIDNILEKIKTLDIVPIPPIKLSKLTKQKGDEEEVVVCLSDWQLGHKTISFNYAIAQKRVQYLLAKTLRIVELHRTASPIKKINLFLLGDFIQSDKLGWLIDLSELEAILIDQVYEEAVPLLTYFISEIAKYFDKVNVYCVRGNHGRGEKGSSEKNNWDDVIYKTLEVKFSNCPTIKFNVAREYYQVAEIQGWKYLLAHGDQVRGGSYNIPLYALLQRMLRWATAMLSNWNVLCVGHWHSYAHIEQNQQELVVNGTLVSDDEYVRKTYGWNASTSQVLFGVHKRHQIAWMRKIDLLKIK